MEILTSRTFYDQIHVVVISKGVHKLDVEKRDPLNYYTAFIFII